MPIERKLAAIMFTDIAGYTAQMSKDEAVAISLLETKKKVFRPLLKKYNGKLVKEMGDGTLSHFPSSVDATNCSIELQKSLKKHTNLNVRVGVHHGEVLFKDKDVYGDVVNIASRLETMSPAGGILVSKNVYDELRNKKDFDGVELGLQSMKGVGRLIEVYGIKGDLLTEPKPSDYQDNKIDKHSEDEVPSIAIIPFENKGKEEDVFYAYGISVDLISDVSSAGLIRVASKKQIEDAGDLPQDELAKVLDVRYMANGEMWRMGDMFQLSVELYDTKDKKVVWSDRWQEKWDNLPTIKMNLSDGLLKALDTKPIVAKKVDTTNTEAYEYYLKGKYKFEKKKNVEDINIARGLLQKAIDLDDTLLSAKSQMGITYREIDEYDKAMEIYISTLKQAEELDNKIEIGNVLSEIGIIYLLKMDLDKALDYTLRSLKIAEKINWKNGIGKNFWQLGGVYRSYGDYEKSLIYNLKALKIGEEISDNRAIEYALNDIGLLYQETGDYDKALEYYFRSIKICDEIIDKRGMARTISNVGEVYYLKGYNKKALEYFSKASKIRQKMNIQSGFIFGLILFRSGVISFDKGDYKKAEEYLDKSLTPKTKIGELPLWINAYLYLTYKHLGKDYDVKEIHGLIKEAENIEFELNLRLYELLEDKSYLETANSQIKIITDNLEPDVAATFLSYPIPKAIVEEWGKVK